MVVKKTDSNANITAQQNQAQGNQKASKQAKATKAPSVIEQLVDLQKAEGSLNKVLSGEKSDEIAYHEDSNQHADHNDHACK